MKSRLFLQKSVVWLLLGFVASTFGASKWWQIDYELPERLPAPQRHGTLWLDLARGILRLTGRSIQTSFGVAQVSVIINAEKKQVSTSFKVKDLDGRDEIDPVLADSGSDQCIWYPFPDPSDQDVEKVHHRFNTFLKQVSQGSVLKTKEEDSLAAYQYPPGEDSLAGYDVAGNFGESSGRSKILDWVRSEEIELNFITDVSGGVNLLGSLDNLKRVKVWKHNGSEIKSEYKITKIQSSWPDDSTFHPPFLPKLDPSEWQCERYSPGLHDSRLAHFGLGKLDHRSLALIDAVVAMEFFHKASTDALGSVEESYNVVNSIGGMTDGVASSAVSTDDIIPFLSGLTLPGELAVFLEEPKAPDFSMYDKIYFEYSSVTSKYGRGSRGKLYAQFPPDGKIDGKLRLEIEYSSRKTMTMILNDDQLYTNLAVKYDGKFHHSEDADGDDDSDAYWTGSSKSSGSSSSGSGWWLTGGSAEATTTTNDLCAIESLTGTSKVARRTEAYRDKILASFLQLSKQSKFIFVGSTDVEGKECLGFEIDLLRHKKMRVYVEPGKVAPRIWWIEIFFRDKSVLRTEVRHFIGSVRSEYTMAAIESSSTGIENTNPLYGEANAPKIDTVFNDLTFKPSEQWGCKAYSREIDVLKSQGMSLPMEYRSSISKRKHVMGSHRKSLSFNDAIVALSPSENDPQFTHVKELSRVSIVAAVLALPGEVDMVAKKPKFPAFNTIQTLQFDYTALTSMNHGGHRNDGALAAYNSGAAYSTSHDPVFSSANSQLDSHTMTNMYVRTGGRFSLNVPQGLMAMSGWSDPSTPFPSFGNINATVIVRTAENQELTELSWTKPSKGAQCLVEDIPNDLVYTYTTNSDSYYGSTQMESTTKNSLADLTKSQAKEPEKFIGAVTLDDDITECNLFSLKMSRGRFLHMYVSRGGSLQMMRLFRAKHPERAYSTIKFSNWHEKPPPSMMSFQEHPDWHCHKYAETTDEVKSELARDDEDEVFGIDGRSGPGLVPAHAKSLSLKESIFGLGSALGQYKMLAIPLMTLPGELDLLFQRPKTVDKDDLRHFEMEFKAVMRGLGGEKESDDALGFLGSIFNPFAEDEEHISSSATGTGDVESDSINRKNIYHRSKNGFTGRMYVDFASGIFVLSARSSSQDGFWGDTRMKIGVNSISSHEFVQFSHTGRTSSDKYQDAQQFKKRNYCFKYKIDKNSNGDENVSGNMNAGSYYSSTGHSYSGGNKKKDRNLFHFAGTKLVTLLNDAEVEAHVQDLNLGKFYLRVYISVEDSEVVRIDLMPDPTSTEDGDQSNADVLGSLYSAGTYDQGSSTSELGGMAGPAKREQKPTISLFPTNWRTYTVGQETTWERKQKHKAPAECKEGFEDGYSLLHAPLDDGVFPSPNVISALISEDAKGTRSPATQYSVLGLATEWPRLAEHFVTACRNENSCRKFETSATFSSGENDYMGDREVENPLEEPTMSKQDYTEAKKEKYAEKYDDYTSSSKSSDDPSYQVPTDMTSTTSFSTASHAPIKAEPAEKPSAAYYDDSLSWVGLTRRNPVIEGGGPLTHLLSHTFKFHFRSVRRKHPGAWSNDVNNVYTNAQRKTDVGEGSLLVDYPRSILYLQSSTKAYQHAEIESKLIIVGNRVFSHLKTFKGEQCITFALPTDGDSEEDSGSLFYSVSEGSEVVGPKLKNRFGLSRAREISRTKKNRKKFSISSDERVFISVDNRFLFRTDTQTSSLHEIDVPKKGITVEIHNWQHPGREETNKWIEAFPGASCVPQDNVISRDKLHFHWAILDLFMA